MFVSIVVQLWSKLHVLLGQTVLRTLLCRIPQYCLHFLLTIPTTRPLRTRQLFGTTFDFSNNFSYKRHKQCQNTFNSIGVFMSATSINKKFNKYKNYDNVLNHTSIAPSNGNRLKNVRHVGLVVKTSALRSG